MANDVDWFDDGWDFVVARIGPWAVRMARTPSGQFRLRREQACLRVLGDAPCAIPRYDRVAPGMGVYRWIKTDMHSRAETGAMYLADVATFVQWLHTNQGPQSWQDGRATWIRRVTVACRSAVRTVGPLLASKEERVLTDRLEAGLTVLRSTVWRVALLHGDLSTDHALVGGGRLAGVIDFGDWRWGDEAFDWSGILGLRDASPPGIAENERLWQRVAFYQLLRPFRAVQWGFRIGHVETVEKHLRVVRRLLKTERG